MNVEFVDDDRSDLDAAREYYRNEEPELETRFVRNVYFALDRVLENPEAWRLESESTRRISFRLFPYAILYHIKRDTIFMLAVMHHRRNPNVWTDRTIST